MSENETSEDALTFPRNVGTTLNADRFDVDEAEYTDLKRLGILVDEDAPVPAPEPGTSTPATKPANSPAAPATPVASSPSTEGGGS